MDPCAFHLSVPLGASLLVRAILTISCLWTLSVPGIAGAFVGPNRRSYHDRFIWKMDPKRKPRAAGAALFAGGECSERIADLPKLTILIPAFNESQRIGPTLETYRKYLSGFYSAHGEILVVDDGSKDGTPDLVRNNFSTPCVSLDQNQGKGAALARGVQEIEHGLVLIADADGSGDIQCLGAMMERLSEITQGDWETAAVVVGNRGSSGESLSRSILRWGFRTTVAILCGDLGGIKDTQCGFKLMTCSAAKILYDDLHLKGWSHDVEVLYRAKRLHIPLAEQMIQWEDAEGSKIVTSFGGVVGTSIQMLLEVALLRIAYESGLWSLPKKVDR